MATDPETLSRLVKAWTRNNGSSWHETSRSSLHDNWPELARALDAVAIEHLGANPPTRAEPPGALAKLPHSILWWPEKHQQVPITNNPGVHQELYPGRPYVATLQIEHHTDGAPVVVYRIESHRCTFEVLRVGSYGTAAEDTAQDALQAIARNWQDHAG